MYSESLLIKVRCYNERHKQTAVKTNTHTDRRCEPCPFGEINRKLFDQGLMRRGTFVLTWWSMQ